MMARPDKAIYTAGPGDAGMFTASRTRRSTSALSILPRQLTDGLTLTGADRTRKEYRTRDTGDAVGVRCSVEFGGVPESLLAYRVWHMDEQVRTKSETVERIDH